MPKDLAAFSNDFDVQYRSKQSRMKAIAHVERRFASFGEEGHAAAAHALSKQLSKTKAGLPKYSQREMRSRKRHVLRLRWRMNIDVRLLNVLTDRRNIARRTTNLHER
jgi:hypothetical protein